MFGFVCKNRGSISVMLSIIFIPIFSLTTLFVEIGRYRSAKQIMQEVMNSANMSMLAGYDQTLQDRFGLLAFDPDKVSEESMMEYIKYNSNLTDGVKNSNLGTLYNPTSLDFTSLYSLGDNEILRRQIIEASKFLIPFSTFSEAIELEDKLEDLRKELDDKVPQLDKLLAGANIMSGLADSVENMYNLQCAIEALDYNLNGTVAEEGGVLKSVYGENEIPMTGQPLSKTYEELKQAVNSYSSFLRANDPPPPEPGPAPSPSTDEEGNTTSEYSAWESRANRYDNYMTNKSRLEKKVDDKAGSYKKSCEAARKSLVEYKEAVEGMEESMEELTDGVTELLPEKKEEDGGDSEKTEVGMVDEDALNEYPSEKDAESGLRDFSDALKECGSAKTEDGIHALQGVIDSMGSFSSDDVTKYTGASSIPYVDVSEYHMPFGSVMAYAVILNGIISAEKNEEMSEMLELVEFMSELITFFPQPYNKEYDVVLGSQTADILPSKVSVTQQSFDDDMKYVQDLLDSIQEDIGDKYSFDINSISPAARAEQWQKFAEMGDRIEETMVSLAELVTMAVTVANTFPMGLVLLICTLKEVIDDIITVITNLIFFANNFSMMVEYIVSSIYDNVMINGYAIHSFPNRVFEMEDCVSDEGKKATDYQTFSRAQAEYVFAGTNDEKVNQQKAYYFIFLIRLLINIVAVMNDSTCRKIIISTPPYSYLLYPVIVYFETIMDMTLLINAESKLPTFKTTLILSLENFKNTIQALREGLTAERRADSFTEIIKDSLQPGEGGLKLGSSPKPSDGVVIIKDKPLPEQESIDLKLNYKEYLGIMMCLVSEEKKLKRIADLVQMERRYTQLVKEGEDPDFLINEADTYVRTVLSANYNSVLPVFSLGESEFSFDIFKLKQLKYAGY